MDIEEFDSELHFVSEVQVLLTFSAESVYTFGLDFLFLENNLPKELELATLLVEKQEVMSALHTEPIVRVFLAAIILIYVKGVKRHTLGNQLGTLRQFRQIGGRNLVEGEHLVVLLEEEAQLLS